MRKLTVLMLIASCSLLPSRLLAQSALSSSQVRGSISDTVDKKSLFSSSILLLRKTDSILVRHTRSDKSGNFTLPKVQPGPYLLLITYPKYADYVEEVEIKDSGDLVLPPISMVMKSKLLEQVVVHGNKGAIHIKGDTVEFTADSFKTQAGANVEELLKKLPGIQVDRNGKITAQGETVQKVLVDGEEFFGDDPTLVTKNLRADMVDKVQVFDKKSDQANFTGIDDGQRTKTINVKLKDSKKNGYFGQVTGGLGTEGYYDEQAMLNMFRKKQKLAVYGIISNTGKTGLNWNERDKYGQSIAGMVDYDEANGFSLDMNQDELDSWSGRYEGQGLPSVKTGGAHYNDKWQDDRQSVNGNYKYMDLSVKSSSNTNTQYILPDTLYYNFQREDSKKNIIRHSIDGFYEVKLDSTSSLKISANGGTDHKVTSSAFSSIAMAADSSKVNGNDRDINSTGDKTSVNSNILWRKKLAKKGRTFSLNVRENYEKNTSTGYLRSTFYYYDNNQLTHDSVTDQYKDYHTENIMFDSKLTYTEPLSASSFLSVNYGLVTDNSHSNRSSFNKEAGGKYGQLDSLYSNDYQFNVLTHRTGLSYSLVKKKFRLSAGNNIGFTDFSQKDLHADTSVKRNFINWYPSASFTWNIGAQRRLNINYNGHTSQPSIQQIQPIRVNEDPLNIMIGNPDLKPEFVNEVYMYYNDYKVLTSRGIFANLSYRSTNNAIASRIDVDSSGKRVFQSVNVNGNFSINGYFSYNFKWAKPEINFDLFARTDQSRNVSIVNALRNVTNNGNYELGAGFYKSKEKKFSAGMRSSATLTRSRSSVNSAITTDYWTWSINPELDVYLPWKFQMHADCGISIRQKTIAFNTNNNVTLLNGWIGKKFGKNDALMIKAAGNDLLNQNIGFNRSTNSNFVSQNTYTTIKRFFMFSVVWNFTKSGAATPAGPSTIISN